MGCLCLSTDATGSSTSGEKERLSPSAMNVESGVRVQLTSVVHSEWNFNFKKDQVFARFDLPDGVTKDILMELKR